jgi:hypothetical protein
VLLFLLRARPSSKNSLFPFFFLFLRGLARSETWGNVGEGQQSSADLPVLRGCGFSELNPKILLCTMGQCCTILAFSVQIDYTPFA